MTISAALVTLIVSVFIPFATSAITKAAAATWLKQVVTALLSAITGLLVATATVDGGAQVTKTAALLAIGSFISAIATYGNFWQAHNLNAKVLPTIGLGTPAPPAPPLAQAA